MRKNLLLIAFTLFFLSGFSIKPIKAIQLVTPKRPAGQTDVLELRCKPMDSVRIAIIGVGKRGLDAVRRYCYIDKVRIVAIADVHEVLLSPSFAHAAAEIIGDGQDDVLVGLSQQQREKKK